MKIENNDSKILQFEEFTIVEFNNSTNVVGGGGTLGVTNGTSSDVVGTEG